MKTYGTLKYGTITDLVDNEEGWAITCAPHIAIRVKRLFARIRQGRSGVLHVRDTLEVCRDLEWMLERWPLDMDEDTARYLAERAQQHRDQAETAQAILAGGGRPVDVVRKPLREPREYQTVAADLALTMGRLLLVDDVGLGKTMTGLLLLKSAETLPAVVVCQTHLTSQWAEQIRLTWDDLTSHVVTKTQPYDLTTVCDGREPDVVIVPYSKVGQWGPALRDSARTVIFDEIQELRHQGTAKYEGANVLAGGSSLRIGLTATPIYNYGGEIFSVVQMIDPGVLGTSAEFNREWTFGMKGAVREPTALGEYLRDENVMLVRTRKDVGRELDEPIRIPQHVDADPAALEAAQGDAAAMARLILDATSSKEDRFRTSGELDWKMRHATGVAKAPFVAEFVRMLLETEERVVLFGWHRDVYDIWMEQLADFGPMLYTGTETPAKKDAAKRRFCMSDDDRNEALMNGEDYHSVFPECRVLIMSLRSGAGVDGLQEVCSVAVFGELDWSPKVHEQAIGRLFRDGQTSAVAAYFCVSDEGADPLMAEVNNLKEQQSTALLHPDTDPFTAASDSGDRIKELARRVLAQAGAPR